MKPAELVYIALLGVLVYYLVRSCGNQSGPGVQRVDQVAPDYLPGLGAAPAGMEWGVNFAGQWVPVASQKWIEPWL